MYGGYFGMKQKWFLCKTSFDKLNASKLWKDQKYPPVPDRFEKKIVPETNFFARQRRHYFRKKTVSLRKYRFSMKKKMSFLSKLYNIPEISTAKNRMLLKTFAISANKKYLKNIFLRYKKKYPDVKFNSFYLALLNRFKGRYKMKFKQKYTTFDALYRKVKVKKFIFHDTMALVKPLVASFVSPKVDFKLFSTRDDNISLKRKRSSSIRKLFRKKRLTSRDKKDRNKRIRFNRKFGSPTPGIFGNYFHKYLLSVVSYNKAVRHIVLKYKKKHDLIYEAKQKEKKAFYAEQKKRKQQFYNDQKEKRRQFYEDRKKKPIFEQNASKNNTFNRWDYHRSHFPAQNDSIPKHINKKKNNYDF